jgi:hypothetical protein
VSAARLVPAAVLATGCLSKPSFECAFAPGPGLYELEARIGTDGGVPHDPPAVCGDRSVVGVGFTLTRGVNMMFGERTAVTATLRCATVSTRAGDSATGAADDVEVPGGSAMSEGPFFADCPGGQVVIGLAAHIVDPAMDHLFNSIAIDCSTLDESGAPAGGVTRVPLVATGTRPPDIQVRCNRGEALHGLKSWTGSELDQLQLACRRTTCMPPP